MSRVTKTKFNVTQLILVGVIFVCIIGIIAAIFFGDQTRALTNALGLDDSILTKEDSEMKKYMDSCRSYGYAQLVERNSQLQGSDIKVKCIVTSMSDGVIMGQFYQGYGEGNQDEMVRIELAWHGDNIAFNDRVTFYGELGPVAPSMTSGGERVTIPTMVCKYYKIGEQVGTDGIF